MLDNYEFVDIWRILNPNSRAYTWCRNHPLVQSRLDYWFIPREMIYSVENCCILPSIKTDHKLIKIIINIHKEDKRGPGLWKFNSTLLHNEEYVSKVKDIINTDFHITDDRVNWDFKKMKIREFSIAFSKELRKKEKENEKLLIADLNKASVLVDTIPSDENLDKLNKLTMRLERLNESKTNGAIVRARAQWIEKGEKNSKLFLNLEKRNYKAKHITKLKIKDEEYTQIPHEILDLQRQFYENLYSTDKRSPLHDDFFMNDLPQISIENKIVTDSPLTIEELTNAIKLMKTGKSPGSDGLSTEFYKFFWNDIKIIVFKSLDTAYSCNLMSEEQRRAVLRLIPKKDKNITELKNWRPISLLNTDYKILAHALSHRLQKVLPEIISKDQNAYMKGRFIGYNIRTILDIIEITNTEKLKTSIAFLDFEKAFDKLNWEFINKCLMSFGFGPNIIKWVTIMYNDISSCVINNGYTSRYFKLKCGIRQGCPLSALLFIIAAETLACSIRKNINIRGIQLGTSEVKVSQLADDTTVFLKDIQSLQTALNTLFMFHQSSGLKLNYAKTEVLGFNHCYGNKSNPFNLTWVKERVYALGTWFYKDLNQCVTKNHEARLKSFQSILKTWKSRYLTIFGKITVIKSLALAKLNYCIMTLPTPEWFVKSVQRDINAFLWNDKPSKIKYSTAISTYADGGVKLTDFDSFVKTQKVLWAKSLLDADQASAHYLQTFIKMKLCHFLNCNLDPAMIPIYIPFFYRQVLYAWFNFKNIVGDSYIHKNVLWNNKHILIQKKNIFFKDWYDKGVIFLSDLMNEEGKIISYETFREKYNIKCNQLKFMGLIDAIPRHLRKCQTFDTNLKMFNIFLLKSKIIYWKHIELIQKEASCIISWNQNCNIKFTLDEWKVIFYLPQTLTSHTKILEMQLKILHRVYATDSYVSNFDKSVNKTCIVCNVKNDIVHWFYECICLKPFLELFENWLTRYIEMNIKLDKKVMIFGYIEEKNFLVNYCILYAKMFINKIRRGCCAKIRLYFSFTSFLQVLKNAVCIEKEIAFTIP